MNEENVVIRRMSDVVLSPEFQERQRACEIEYRRGFHHGAMKAASLVPSDRYYRAVLQRWLIGVSAWRQAYLRHEDTADSPPEAEA
jgi:hypothetical protein